MTDWLLERFKQYGEQIAIVDKHGCYSYQEVNLRINLWIEILNEHISSGDRVILYSDGSFSSVCLFLACHQLKLIVIPVVPCDGCNLKEKIKITNSQFILSFEQSELMIEATEYKEVVSNGLYNNIIEKQHSGLVLFSSGSTGQPKAMLHDLTVLLESYRNKKPKQISILAFLLFDHIGGINTILSSLSIGAKVILPQNREVDHIAGLIEQEHITVLPTSPTFLNLLLLADVQFRYDLNSIRLITYGTESMPEPLLEKIKRKFPKAKLLQTFGTSETGILRSRSRASNSLELKFDDPNVKYKVIDGELWLKSKTQILGYLNADMEKFSVDGWYATGDIVEVRDNGFLKIVGRISEIINVGGEKVLPVEIEAVILTVEGVLDCLVYGKESPITGQTVATDIVSRSDIDTSILKKQIQKACIDKLARYKVPTKICFVEKMKVGRRFKKQLSARGQ